MEARREKGAMRLIFIGSLPELEKKSTIKIAMKRFGKKKKNLKIIHFDEMDSLIKDFNNLTKEELESLGDQVYDEIEEKIGDTLASDGVVVLDGFFTIRSKLGHIPLITEKFFKVFQPNQIVLIETYPDLLSSDSKVVDELKEQQIINRIYAVRSASLIGSPIKIIKMDKEVSNVIKELDNLI